MRCASCLVPFCYAGSMERTFEVLIHMPQFLLSPSNLVRERKRGQVHECSDDELCSDSFPMKLVDGLIWEFKGKQVVRKEGDIVLAGANPSAEGDDVDEGTEEHVERGIDFVLNHRLQEMSCYENVATFKSYVKSFMKKVVDLMAKNGKSEEEINEFKKKIQAWVVSLLSKDRFKQLQFFIGEKMAEGHGDGQVAIVEYRDEPEGEVPYLMLVKEALVEEKQ